MNCNSTPNEPKENPAPPPTVPASRLSIHKVKNGWTLDVDYAATRQFGDTYTSPAYVYTKATRLVSDVMGFLLNGKEAESDFVGRHLGIYPHPIPSPLPLPPPSPTTIERVKAEAFADGRASLNGVLDSLQFNVEFLIQQRDEAITALAESNNVRSRLVAYSDDVARESCDLRWKLGGAKADLDAAVSIGNRALKDRDEAIKERNDLREQWNDAYARAKHKGEKNAHDKGYDRHPSAEISELKERLNAAIKERDDIRKQCGPHRETR